MKPWMSDIEIDLVMKYLSSEKTMLEWGSGGSTNTFSKYVKKYYSIEHDNSWAKKIQNALKLLDMALYNIKKENYLKKRTSCQSGYGCPLYQTELCK